MGGLTKKKSTGAKKGMIFSQSRLHRGFIKNSDKDDCLCLQNFGQNSNKNSLREFLWLNSDWIKWNIMVYYPGPSFQFTESLVFFNFSEFCQCSRRQWNSSRILVTKVAVFKIFWITICYTIFVYLKDEKDLKRRQLRIGVENFLRAIFIEK